MEIGDLVLWNNKELGLIVDIDPLRGEEWMYEYDKINEIVVLKSGGGVWYTSPAGWEVINESR